MNKPLRHHELISHEKQLSDDAEYVEMYAKREKEVPELENLIERGRTSTEGHYGCDATLSVDPG